MSEAAVQDRVGNEVEDEVHDGFEAETGSDQGAHGELELRTSILPAPTMPASLVADGRPEEQGGGGCMGIPNAYSGSRLESAMNKKPYALVKLGHRLCGFHR